MRCSSRVTALAHAACDWRCARVAACCALVALHAEPLHKEPLGALIGLPRGNDILGLRAESFPPMAEGAVRHARRFRQCREPNLFRHWSAPSLVGTWRESTT